VTVGGSHFSQAGGTFTAPADSLIIQGNFTVTAGTFTHNSGTLYLNQIGYGSTRTIDVPTSLTLNHLTFGGYDYNGYNSALTHSIATGIPSSRPGPSPSSGMLPPPGSSWSAGARWRPGGT
ncbi:MAG: hypothetical protein HYS69_05255, partial [candidate division NC10 bacterium]|nr:hypothetical protein [candidate division NC10 bacterium]